MRIKANVGNPRSKLAGVTYSEGKRVVNGESRKYPRWCVEYTINGKRRATSFSVKRYGYKAAYKMAVVLRRKAKEGLLDNALKK